MDRRKYLLATTAVMSGVAGCTGVLDESEEDDTPASGERQDGTGDNPNNSAETATPVVTVTADTPEAAVQSYIAAVDAGAVQIVNSLHHPRGEANEFREAQAEEVAETDLTIDDLEVVEKDDWTAVVEATLTAEQDGQEETDTVRYTVQLHEGQWKLYDSVAIQSSAETELQELGLRLTKVLDADENESEFPLWRLDNLGDELIVAVKSNFNAQGQWNEADDGFRPTEYTEFFFTIAPEGDREFYGDPNPPIRGDAWTQSDFPPQQPDADVMFTPTEYDRGVVGTVPNPTSLEPDDIQTISNEGMNGSTGKIDVSAETAGEGRLQAAVSAGHWESATEVTLEGLTEEASFTVSSPAPQFEVTPTHAGLEDDNVRTIRLEVEARSEIPVSGTTAVITSRGDNTIQTYSGKEDGVQSFREMETDPCLVTDTIGDERVGQTETYEYDVNISLDFPVNETDTLGILIMDEYYPLAFGEATYKSLLS